MAMSDVAWIALSGVAMSVIIAALGGIFKQLNNIDRRFNKVDELASARHIENVQRFVRLETLVNGSYTRKRRAGA